MVFGAGVSKWLALAALMALLWVARGVLPPFIIAGIFAYILSPLVDELAVRSGVRRPLIALAVFAVVLVVFLGLLWIAGARLNAELRAIAREGPSIIGSVVDRLTGGQSIDLLGQSTTSAELGRRLDIALRDALGTPSQAIEAIRAAFDLTLAVVLVFLGLVYFLIDGHNFWVWLLRFVPREHRNHVDGLAVEIHHVLGRYLRGQLVLIILMSTVTFCLLEWAFRLPYALWIGILTGILEVIPLIGPITAGVIACTVGFSQGGPTEAAALAIMYVILRQVEDQLVMPIIVGRAVHVHPLVTIFAVLTGERIAGILGMILAVPIAAAIKVVLDHAYPKPMPTIVRPAEGIVTPAPEVIVR
ncbi:MAG TPA: AI-2E family transporter [Chloroflexota bacterium]|nr:AI-2E family transporter [Chloroflexota bacterium]